MTQATKTYDVSMRRFLRHTKEVGELRELLIVGSILLLVSLALTAYLYGHGQRGIAEAKAGLEQLRAEGASQSAVRAARAELGRQETETAWLTGGGMVFAAIGVVLTVWGGIGLYRAVRHADDYVLYIGRLTDPHRESLLRTINNYSFTARFRDTDGSRLSRPVRRFDLGKRFTDKEIQREVSAWTTRRVLLAYDAKRDRLLLFGFASDFPAAAEEVLSFSEE